jgi:gamma-glutamyl-gamma-aminobutyrate hydrolase PuuD
MNRPTLGLFLPPFLNLKSNSKFNKENKKLIVDHDHVNNIRFAKLLKKLNFNVVIIPYTISEYKIDKYLDNIDALCITGTPVYNSENYPPEFLKQLNIFKKIFKKIIEINKKRPFPIIGQCHGYELIIHSVESTDFKNNLFDTDFNTVFKAKNRFISEKHMDDKKLIECYFSVALTPKTFTHTKNLKKNYKIVSISKDKNGKEFVSSIKHKEYFILFIKYFANNNNLFKEFLKRLKEGYNFRIKNRFESFKIPRLNFRTYSYTNFLDKDHPEYENALKHNEKVRIYEINTL